MAYDYNFRGLYLEDFELGKAYLSPARTVTEADVVAFAGLSGDYNPMHTDEEYAKQNFFGTRIAHGALGFAISTGLSNQMGIFEGTVIAFMECTVKYAAPLRIGDTIHVAITPTEVRHSSKPGKGVLKQHLELINQEGTVVMVSDQVLMMKSRV